MNTLGLSDIGRVETSGTSSNRDVSTNTYSPSPTEAPAMSMMNMATPEPSYVVVEYASTMRLYAKPYPWMSEDIVSRSGNGLIVRDTPTEKRSIIETKVSKLLEEKSVTSSIVTYQMMQKIAVDPERLFYLVPVLEYTTDTGEKIRISLIRGFR